MADLAELSLATQNLSISVQLLKAERKNKSLTEKVRGFSREVYISRTKRLIRKQVAVNPYLVLVSSDIHNRMLCYVWVALLHYSTEAGFFLPQNLLYSEIHVVHFK